ncbi:MAG: family 10 glycosylhydrolase [Saprospiraceae bacterium]|nr:family 10 glycosylhydrolase [Saprospiraceae bacterium]
MDFTTSARKHGRIVCLIPLFLLFLVSAFPPAGAQNFEPVRASSEDQWPSDLPWWKRNNLRVMQCNLPAYEATLNVDSLLEDLVRFSVNTLIINGGGIMAFYPTDLDFQYTNPFMQKEMLDQVVQKCHALNIRVVTRFDFSRFHRSIFDEHPDWAYISPSGERIINDDMYMAAINGPYVQEKSVEIIRELITKYPVDGIFINMPGYHTSNAYEGTYHGIDQNEFDRKRFYQFSGGDNLPVEENPEDPVFQKYQEFKKFTSDDWMKKIHTAVKSINPDIAICTYQEKYVDIIRHESQTNSLPYWPYMSFDNVTNTVHSQPDHIVSNASIQQISFRSRYNAIEPEETAIRLYENLAAGSGLDMSLMGDFRQYEDERNFETWEKIYAFHRKFEPYYGKYHSLAEICVISPSYWPGGVSGQEYRGIQLMLKEAHLQYDIINYAEIYNRRQELSNYKVIIIPQIPEVSEQSAKVLADLCGSGANLIATNQSFSKNPALLSALFGVKPVKTENNADGYYLEPKDKLFFRRFGSQRLLFCKFNLGFYDMSGCDERYLPILTPGRPGPPEKIGGHEPSGFHAVGLKKNGRGMAATVPFNLGRLYYIHGYEQHKNILLDLIDHVFPGSNDLVQTNTHPRIEVVLQEFTENLASKTEIEEKDGLILHLINLTGFSGNTYFTPLPVFDTPFKIRCSVKPEVVYSLVNKQKMPFDWDDGYLTLKVPTLDQYEALVIKY